MKMADWLLIRLARAHDPDAHWVTVDASGQPLSSPESGALEQAAPLAAGRRVAVLVAATELLQTTVELPPNAGNRLQQIVPYALEEQLAGDVETQHCAVGVRDPASTRVAVASVERELMQSWMQSLADAGIKPDLLCADSALLPENPGNTVAWLDGEALYLRPSGSSAPPLSLPSSQPLQALELAAAAGGLQELHLILYVTPLDWQRRGAEFEALRSHLGSLKVQLLGNGTLLWLATLLLGNTAINLLQGEYAPRTSWGLQWQRWRVAALLLGVLILVHGLGVGLHGRQLARSDEQLDAAIRDFASLNIPGDSGSGAVRARAEKRLLEAQKANGQDPLLDVLGALAAATRQVPGVAVQTLSLRREGVELKLRTPDADSLEKINDSLASQGLHSQLASGAAQGDAYEGRLQVKLRGRS